MKVLATTLSTLGISTQRIRGIAPIRLQHLSPAFCTGHTKVYRSHLQLVCNSLSSQGIGEMLLCAPVTNFLPCTDMVCIIDLQLACNAISPRECWSITPVASYHMHMRTNSFTIGVQPQHSENLGYWLVEYRTCHN